MKYFPMFLRMEGETVVIAGGGEQAAQKLRLMLKTEARLVVAAPGLDAEIAAAVRDGRVTHHAGAPDAALLRGARLLFCATGCAGADAALATLGRAHGVLVNAVDRPDLCDAVTPALVDRDPVVVAIGTEGTSPVLAREIRTRIEAMLEPSLGGFAAWMGALRGTVAARVPRPARRAFWEGLLRGPARGAFGRGGAEAAWAEAERLMAQAEPVGRVSLVGAGPGAADLITLRAVQRLQDADIVFYDRLVDPAVLELARRDAERVFVGKAPGVKAWSQARINRLLVAAAREGRCVVRLKCGDPGIFGRAGEEIVALAEAGFPVEIVPGVTAASAAAAHVGRPLTDRAAGRSILIVSAHPAEGAPPLDWQALAATDAVLAVYMGVAKAPAIAAALIAGGAAGSTPVRVVERAGCADARDLSTTLAAMPEAIRTAGLANPAIILIDPPAAQAQAAAWPTIAMAG